MKDLLTRVLIGVVGVPAILAIIILGKFYFLIFLMVVSAISQYEFYHMYSLKNRSKGYAVHGIIFGLLWLVATYFAPQYYYHLILIPTMLFLMLNLREPIAKSTEKLAISLTGYLYIPVLLSSLIMIREAGNYTILSDAEAWKIVLVLFITIWVNDTAAYFIGSKFGKNKLAANISPKKSREGSMAGILGAFLAVFLFYCIDFLPEFFTPVHAVVLSLILGILPQLGDLAESMMKRDNEVKDSGKILLGHGGVLDRFDAVFLTAPAVYLFIDVSLKLIN